MKRWWQTGILLLGLCSFSAPLLAQGDPARGERLFNGFLRCYACHSLEPGVNKVGPSLAWLFGRAAGTVTAYDGYSNALLTSGIIWYADTLDAFLANPQRVIPGNRMALDDYFVSDMIPSAQNRADLIAYLEQATQNLND